MILSKAWGAGVRGLLVRWNNAGYEPEPDHHLDHGFLII